MHQPAFPETERPLPGAAPGAEAEEASWGSAVKLAAESAGRLLGLATTLLIARALGVSGFGDFAFLSGIAVMIAEAGDLGLQGTASRSLVAGTLPLRSMIRAKLLLTVAVLAGALGLLAWAPLLAALLLYFTLAGWSEFLGVALRACGRRGQEAATILCLRGSGLACVATALRSGGGLATLTWALALSPLPAIVLASNLVRRANGSSSHGGQAAQQGVRAVLASSFPLAVNGGLALASLRVELIVLKLLRGSREAGLFAAALRVIEFLNLVPSAVGAGAMPALTREGLRGDGPVRQRTAATVALLAAPTAAGLALVAPGLADLLFGAEYASAAAPLRLLALALVALFMNAVLLHSLIAVGRADALPRLTAVRLAVAVFWAFVLIPELGALGAASGFLVSELVLMALASRACAAARFQVPLVRPLASAVGVSLPMAVAVALSGSGLAASIALGVLTYAVTLALTWRLLPRLLEPLQADVRCS